MHCKHLLGALGAAIINLVFHIENYIYLLNFKTIDLIKYVRANKRHKSQELCFLN